jgi:UDP-GlcNAc3NAcA epimerase
VVSISFTRQPGLEEVLVHTGQHFDANMSDVFFEELEIPRPDFHLGIGGGTHGQNTGRMITEVERVLLEQRPDWVLVYGDTDSTLAGALAAVKLHIPVAHVEAGLRSFNRRMPEEINRVLTDHASSLLFPPTETAVGNLQKEGITGDSVALVGDVMLDAALFYGARADAASGVLSRLGLAPQSYVLATIHRQENTDDCARLSAILKGFGASPLPIVLPLHPRTRKRIADFGLEIPSTVRIIDPVGYLDMVMLERHARLITTDSGGVQKEAFFHRVPCLTLREETEWVELVACGANRLVRIEAAAIAEALRTEWGFPAEAGSLYGHGVSGEAIVAALAATWERAQ